MECITPENESMLIDALAVDKTEISNPDFMLDIPNPHLWPDALEPEPCVHRNTLDVGQHPFPEHNTSSSRGQTLSILQGKLFSH